MSWAPCTLLVFLLDLVCCFVIRNYSLGQGSIHVDCVLLTWVYLQMKTRYASMRPYGKYLRNQVVTLDEIVQDAQRAQGIANNVHNIVSNGTTDESFQNVNGTKGNRNGNTGNGSTNISAGELGLLRILDKLKAFG